MPSIACGPLRKLTSELQSPVAYKMPIGDQQIALNPLLGKTLRLEFQALINCIECGRKTKKSFNQGFCYPCFKKLACCDICIVSPEKCHLDQGTCREPEWAENFCLQEHIVYLANSSGLKVGITRGTQVPTRWVDQGAIQALPVFRVQTRLQSGIVEVVFKQFTADKTNWRKMLKGEVEEIDLGVERDRLLGEAKDDIERLQQELGLQALQLIDDTQALEINYPVLEYPTKVTSMNFDKNPVVEGTLMGIKGQYLILDTGVINIRKFAGYHIELTEL